MSVNTKINGQLVKSASLAKAIIPVGIAECYSTEERQIGCWKDGRPLYQKSFVLTSSLTVSHETFTNTGFSIPNVDAIRYGEAYRVGNLGLIACDFNVTSSNTIGIRNSTLYDISFGVDSVITIQYTKSTDTAGSGIWTPSGEYAVHYSTDEQVIGTYLGKTLYRKAFVLSANHGTVAGSTWKAIPDINDSNMEIVTSCKYIYSDTASIYVNYELTTSTNRAYFNNQLAVMHFRNANIGFTAGNVIIVEYTKIND